MKVFSVERSRIDRAGLRKGSRAPRFTTSLLMGGHINLEDFHGRRVLLVFSDPKCGPCNDLLLCLQRLRLRTPDVAVLVISRGDKELNAQKMAKHSLSFPIALQHHWEISRRYAIFFTPAAYLIDEAGKTMANVAVGKRAILQLLIGAQILTLLNSVEDSSQEFEPRSA